MNRENELFLLKALVKRKKMASKGDLWTFDELDESQMSGDKKKRKETFKQTRNSKQASNRVNLPPSHGGNPLRLSIALNNYL